MVEIRNNRQASVCHPNREMRAHGLCPSCYAAYRKDKTKFSEIVTKYKLEKENRLAQSIIRREERAKIRRLQSPWVYKSVKQRYGLSKEEYDYLVQSHNNHCKLCGRYTQKLCVDHCHKTGIVRGLLCHKCNIIVGVIENNSVEFLQLAAAYSKAMTKGTMEDIEW